MNKVVTRIQLVDGSALGYLDVKEGSEFPINYKIGDIRDLSSRSGSFSKTIKLAGTKNNNLLLNNYFDVNVKAGTFDVNKRQKCIVIQNDVIVLDNAYLRLLSVKKIQNRGEEIDNYVEYEVQVRDSLGDFFKEINNKELTDLKGFDIFNHIYTAQNVQSSFSHTWQDGYKYVLPWIEDNTYFLNECFPAIYAKQYWDFIHEQAGYTYEWDTLSADTVQFDKLIIPFNGDVKKLSDELLNDVQVVYGSTVSQNVDYSTAFFIPGLTSIIQPWTKIQSSFITDNFNSSYNTTTDRWTNPFIIDTPASITYQVRIEWDFIINNTGSTPITTLVNNTLFGTGVYLRKPYVGITPITTIIPIDTKPLIANFSSNGTTINNGFIQRTSSSPSLPPGENILASGINEVELIISPAALGSVYELQTAAKANLEVFTGTYQEIFRIKKIDVRIVPSTDAFGFNYPVELSKFVPQKIKQSDFVKSIYQMYNLFVEIDPTDPNNLIYKHRDKYYDEGDLKDWTFKKHKKKDQTLTFVPEISSKKLVLTYKHDSKDYLQEAYKEETSEIYGQIEVEFDNENVKDTETKELIFSPTLNQPTPFNSNNPVWETFSPKNNIRILLDNGVRSCDFYSIQNYLGNSIQLTNYPFISMINEVTNPSFDIAYAQPDFYPYNVGFGTENNLYTNHWRRTLAQINSGKLLTAYFWLTEEDINKLKLSDKIKVDNALWYINAVVDYDANARRPTKVELLSVEDDLRLPRFGRIVRPVLPGVLPAPVPEPVKPVGPIRPIVGAVKEIVRLRSFNSSVNNSYKDYINLGKGNVINENFTGIIAADNVNARVSGLYFGNVRIDENGKTYFTKGTIIDGGIDVAYPFNKTNPVDIIDGTIDAVRNIGGYKQDRPIIDTNIIN